MTSNQIIIRSIFWLALSLALGILFAPLLLPSPFPFFSSFLAVPLTFFALSLLFRKNPKLFWAFLFFSLFCSGMALYSIRTEKFQNISEGPAIVLGQVNSFPITFTSAYGDHRVRFLMHCKTIKREALQQSVNLQLMVSLPQTSQRVKYGDELIARGEILKAGFQRNPGTFDPENYLLRKQISARLNVKDPQDFKVLSQGKGNPFLFFLWEIKEFLKQKMKKAIPLPERAVLIAMLLGDREEIPWEVNESFTKSGTVHLLSISGLHVTLIATLFIAVGKLLRIPRRWNYLLTIFLLLSYSLLVGLRASVLRSTIMIVFYLLGLILKRDSELICSLSWSAIFILLAEPLQVFDPGFQLSYITVFALGTLGAQWQTLEMGFLVSRQKEQSLLEAPGKFLLWLEKIKFYLKNYLGVSFAAWVGLLPLIAFYFYLFSPVTVLANVVVVPYLWVVTASGFAFLSLGWSNEFLNQTLGNAVWFFAKILILLSDFFASLPFSHFRVPPASFPTIVIFYALFLLYLCKDFFKLRRLHFLFFLLFFVDVWLWKNIFRPVSENLKITFLDVGHGDAALIEFPKRGVLLVDTGGNHTWDTGKMVLAPFLWSKGIRSLDAILITHPHYDHYGGLATLLQEFSVKAVLENGRKGDPLYEQIFKNQKVNRIFLNEGDRITGVQNTELLIFHPSENFLTNPAIKTNDQSIVMQIRYKNIRILMAGDAEQAALEKLASYGQELKSQILKVPHHGSDEKEEGENFFLAVNPETAILTTAEKNPYHLPSPATVTFLKALGAKVFQTGLVGAVLFETDGSTYTLRTMLDS